MNYPLFALLGYLSGSVLYAYYLPLWLKGMDVTVGSSDGNPGAFNCITLAGWPIGLLALACDVLKGALPVFMAAKSLGTGHWAFALVAAAPVAGHAYPLFRGFRGGKAIAVSFGVTLGLWPIWQPFGILAAWYLFFTLVIRLQPHRFRTIVTYGCFTVGLLAHMGTTPVSLGCVLTAVIVIIRHRHREPEEKPPTAQLALKRHA